MSRSFIYDRYLIRGKTHTWYRNESPTSIFVELLLKCCKLPCLLWPWRNNSRSFNIYRLLCLYLVYNWPKYSKPRWYNLRRMNDNTINWFERKSGIWPSRHMSMSFVFEQYLIQSKTYIYYWYESPTSICCWVIARILQITMFALWPWTERSRSFNIYRRLWTYLVFNWP